MKYLAVKDWEDFQHYRDRLPPWIKLYNKLLDNYEFIGLPETSRIHLVLLWLVASRHKDGRIPYDLKYLARAIHAKSRIDIARLVGAGFLTIVEQDATTGAEHSASTDASATLADSTRPAAKVEDASASRALAPAKDDASTRPRPRARERESTRAAESEQTKPAGAPAPEVSGEPAKRGNPTWLTPFLDDWAEKYGGNLAPGHAAGALRPVCRELGITETHRRWRVYLAVTDGRHASVSKFAQTHGVYVSAPAPATNGTRGNGGDPVTDAAWGATLALLPRWHRHEVTTETFAEMSPGMRAGISAIGGFQRLAATADDKRVWLKTDFVAAFRAATQQPPEAQSA